MGTSSTRTDRPQTNARNLRKLLLDVMAAAEPPPLSQRIREAREDLGISQEEAARRLHLSLKGYTAYERFREPKPTRAREIARAFGLDENYFLSSPPDVAADDDRLARMEERLEAMLGEMRGFRAELLAVLSEQPAQPPKAAPSSARRRRGA